MLHAFKLYTGPDNASHVLEGAVAENDRTDVVAIHFKEPHRTPRSIGMTRPSRNT